MAAESLAPEDSRRKVSKLASHLARKPSDLENVEVALDKIAAQTMTGDFRTLLDAARGVFQVTEASILLGRNGFKRLRRRFGQSALRHLLE